MTAPVQAQPEAFDPQNPLHWINVLHNAASVPKTDPRYEAAQTAVNTALQHIGSLNRLASDKDIATANAPIPTGVAIARGLAHGASLGTDELAAGMGSALAGKGFRAGAQNERDLIEDAGNAAPFLEPLSEIVGQGAVSALGAARSPSFSPFAGPTGGPLAGMGVVRAGVPLTARTVGGAMLRSGAEAAPLGFTQGFATGGSDPGSFSQRLQAGLEGAASTGATAASLTPLGLPVARNMVERSADADVGIKPQTGNAGRGGYGLWYPFRRLFAGDQWSIANPILREQGRRQAIVDARNATKELVPPVGTPEGPAPTEPPEITQLRARLEKQGFPGPLIEKLVQQAQSGGRPMAAPATMPPLSPEDAAAIEARRVAAVQGSGNPISTTTTAPPEDLGTFPAPREDPGYTPARGLGVEGGPMPAVPTTPTILEMQEGRQPSLFEQRLLEGLTPPDASEINRPVGTQAPRQVTRSAAVRAPEIPSDPYAQGRTINPPPGATGVNLNSPAAEAQMRYLMSLTPKARAAALQNPLFAAFRAQLGQ